jgi:hypothetical protein
VAVEAVLLPDEAAGLVRPSRALARGVYEQRC